MADISMMVQFTVLFVAAYWCLLFVVPLKAAYYAADGHLVVRRIFLGNVLVALVMRTLRRSGSNLVVEVQGQPAIVGGPAPAASLVQLLVVPWVRVTRTAIASA
jgi:hypothetical protein